MVLMPTTLPLAILTYCRVLRAHRIAVLPNDFQHHHPSSIMMDDGVEKIGSNQEISTIDLGTLAC